MTVGEMIENIKVMERMRAERIIAERVAYTEKRIAEILENTENSIAEEKKNTEKRIAMNMLRNNMGLETIAEITELPLEKIIELSDDNISKN